MHVEITCLVKNFHDELLWLSVRNKVSTITTTFEPTIPSVFLSFQKLEVNQPSNLCVGTHSFRINLVCQSHKWLARKRGTHPFYQQADMSASSCQGQKGNSFCGPAHHASLHLFNAITRAGSQSCIRLRDNRPFISPRGTTLFLETLEQREVCKPARCSVHHRTFFCCRAR